jgi:hypothetical protein
LDAASADFHGFVSLRCFRMDGLQVGEETAFGQIVSVALGMTGHGSFTANITYARHNRLDFYVNNGIIAIKFVNYKYSKNILNKQISGVWDEINGSDVF